MAIVNTNNVERREPETFAAGDTLLFERFWPEYPASQGWYLEGSLTDLDGTMQANSQFQSVADQDAHQVNVANYAAGLVEGDYILAEYVVLSASGGNPAQRHQVYKKVFTLSADLADGLASKPLKTQAQKMIEVLECTLLELYGRKLRETDQERTHFIIQDIEKTETSLFKWQEKRNNEIQMSRAAAGEPAGNVIVPVFSIGA